MNITDPSIIIKVLENPNTPKDIIEKVINKFLFDTNDRTKKPKWFNWQLGDRYSFVLSCARLSLSDDVYYNLLNTIPFSQTTYRTCIFEAMAQNAKLSQKLLDEIQTNISFSDSVQTFCYFNQAVRHEFSITDAQSFLNTVENIYEKISLGSNIGDELDVFIPSNIDGHKKIKDILDKSIEKTNCFLLKEIAKYYKNAVTQKELDLEIENIIETGNVDNASKEILKNAKHVIVQKVIFPYGKTIEKPIEPIKNVFDEYTLYKQIIQYTDLYQKIDDQIMRIALSNISTPKPDDSISSR